MLRTKKLTDILKKTRHLSNLYGRLIPNHFHFKSNRGEANEKSSDYTAGVIFALALSYNMALAGKSSVELGSKLLNDTGLTGSTNDKSCASCHPGGEGLEKAGDKKKLAKTINRCITGALQGKKIDGRSVQMRSLKMYIQSLQ